MTDLKGGQRTEVAPRKLVIWTICDGEPMTIDEGAPRLLRMSMLSQTLAVRGHEVVYWTSRFDHLRKRDRLPQPGRVDSGEGYAIHCTDRVAYSSNVSFRRLWHNAVVRRGAERAMRADPRRPDVIVADLPTLELAELASRLGRLWNVPVVISVRDLWPDVFYLSVPRPIRRIAPLLFARWNRRAIRALKQATSIVGISKGYLNWGLEKAGRARNAKDAIIPLGYPGPQPLDSSKNERAWRALIDRGVSPEKRLVCFVGTFGRSYDLKPVIHAARHLQQRGDIQFILCGEGEQGAEWRKLAEGLDNVVFPGWIDRNEIAVLLSRASIGLAAYASGAKQGLPNKFFEYMSFGLPIISSLDGEARDEIEGYGFGESYIAGDFDGLATSITRVLDDKGRLEKMSEAAENRFVEAYQQENLSSTYAELLEKLAQTAKLPEPCL